MDTDAGKAEFARAVVESQRILAGMRTETKTNDRALAQNLETIHDSREHFCASFDNGK